MKSIIQDKKECYICKTTYNLHLHHIFFGTANRKISDKNGFVIYLCQYHHESDFGVHGKYGDELNRKLKSECQKKYEENHTRQEFINLIGRNFINE